jgi:hypothetical protein
MSGKGGQAAASIGLSIGLGILSGGVGALLTPGAHVLVGMAVGGTVGGIVGGVGVLLTPHASGSGNSGSKYLYSTSLRNAPVPVVFGKAKLAGNYIAMGNFFHYKDEKDGTPGRRLHELHAYLGLCEGPVQAVEDFLLDGQTITEARKAEDWLSEVHYSFVPALGTAGQKLPGYLRTAASRQAYGFDAIADPIAWRNTAYLQCGVNVGEDYRLADITCTVTGPDLSIRRWGRIADTNPHDLVSNFHYDGFTEAFYATLASSDRTAPWGLLKMGREKAHAQHTAPPAAVTQTVAKAWYLGKHDILLMQNPTDPATFHLGYWGIARDSADWETVTPDPGYAAPILAEHLDELNGMLYTLHAGASVCYVMRWNLLTGWISRLDLPIAAGSLPCYGFLYAPDLDAYVIALRDQLAFVDAQTGQTFHSTSKLHTARTRGLCVAGALVGIITDAGVVFYDPHTRVALKHWGSNATTLEPGQFGGIVRAVQNTWTGHISLAKPIDGTVAFANFMASVPPEKLVTVKKRIPHTETVVRRTGTKFVVETVTTYEEKEVQEKQIDTIAGWVRDWSTRQFDRYSLHALEGESAVAAALWATLVDEPCLDSGRWGAGLAPRYACLSSFESVHAYALGPVLYPHKRRDTYQERYHFDYALDTECSAADLLANEMLLSINGYRTLIDGKLHVGVQRTALPMAWHFTDAQIEVDSGQVAYLGRATGANRIRVEFPDASDDYRQSFAEGNDEYDQNVRGRIVTTTLAASGVTRLGQARALAQQVIDALASNRRQVSFKTHWIGFVLSPGDGIEITSDPLGLERFRGRVVSVTENDNNEIEITAVEHQPVRDLLRMMPVRDGDGDASCAQLAQSAEFRENRCMSPMHAAVYEDPLQPRLIPLAGLSPQSRFASELRVDYRFDDDDGWSSLGRMDGSFGGFVRNLTAASPILSLEGLHGTPEKIKGDLPVLICRHEALGPQTPRPTSGDEVALANKYDAPSQAMGVRRSAPQAWAAETPAIDYAYRVHAVADACCDLPLYVQAVDACSLVPLDVYLPAEQIPGYPFHFIVPATGQVCTVPIGAIATEEPGTIYTDWQAIAQTNCTAECGFRVESNSYNNLQTSIQGRFDPTPSWASGAKVLGDQVVAVKLISGGDDPTRTGSRFYPTINGQRVHFDDGSDCLRKNWDYKSLTVKHGDLLNFAWEYWVVPAGPDFPGETGVPALNRSLAGLPLDGSDSSLTVKAGAYPLTLQVTLSGPVAPGTLNFWGYDQGADWQWTSGTSPWTLWMRGDGRESPRYWELQYGGSTCAYKLVGSEGQCSPVGIWRLEPLNVSACSTTGVEQTVAVISIVTP